MSVHLTDAEIACIKRLAGLFEEGKTIQNGADLVPDEPIEKREAILAVMKDLGVIDVDGTMWDRYAQVTIKPKVLQLAREFAEKEREEERQSLMEDFERKHHFGFRPIAQSSPPPVT
jgi:hypothetical protein